MLATLLILAIVGFVGFLLVAGVILIAKLAFHLILLPFKLLFIPIAAVGVILKLVFAVAIGAIVIGFVLAVVVPLVVAAAVIAVPVLAIAALT